MATALKPLVGPDGKPPRFRKDGFMKAMKQVVAEQDANGELIVVNRLREFRDTDPRGFCRLAVKVLAGAV